MNEREALAIAAETLENLCGGYEPDCAQCQAAKIIRALASAPAATQGEAVSPMAKMAQALRGKALAERAAFDTRVQSGEWGPMPDAGTEADCPNAHVATIEGDDAVRQMRWNPNVAAFDYEVGTKLYAAPTPQPTAPARAAEATQAAIRAGYKLVPMIPNADMNRVMDSEGWAWEDLLAAACAITEDEYEQIAGSGTFQPAQPAAAERARSTGYVAPKGRYVPPVLFSPYTGEPRDARDIASDPQGVLIVPPGADLVTATPPSQAPAGVEADIMFPNVDGACNCVLYPNGETKPCAVCDPKPAGVEAAQQGQAGGASLARWSQHG